MNTLFDTFKNFVELVKYEIIQCSVKQRLVTTFGALKKVIIIMGHNRFVVNISKY